MERLKRKIDDYLINWKEQEDRLPLIIKDNGITRFAENPPGVSITTDTQHICRLSYNMPITFYFTLCLI